MKNVYEKYFNTIISLFNLNINTNLIILLF